MNDYFHKGNALLKNPFNTNHMLASLKEKIFFRKLLVYISDQRNGNKWILKLMEFTVSNIFSASMWLVNTDYMKFHCTPNSFFNITLLVQYEV